jgi:ppGpp synthetase/RelA/SpoT-type nucleotidyltranferase
MSVPLSREQRKLIDALVGQFEANKEGLTLLVSSVRDRIQETKSLFKLIHSLKSRVKDSDHLRDKLIRKIEKSTDEKPFDITPENFFEKINDLVGVRLLHLYTHQMRDINAELLSALEEGRFKVKEGPIANTWDIETAHYFTDLGFENVDNQSLYTSVHYVIESNSKTKYTCEIQVRTLAEELWGEVSHSFNYPQPTKSLACAEQIKVLARVTSSCTRLVDSVYRSLREFESQQKPKGRAGAKKPHSSLAVPTSKDKPRTK